MKDAASFHAALQGNIDCYLETVPSEELNAWADRGWAEDAGLGFDESCVKYLALVLLDAVGSSAREIVLEAGCPARVISGCGEHMLPAVPESVFTRGMEILCNICGIEGERSGGTLALGIRGDSLELNIERSGGLHKILLPPL